MDAVDRILDGLSEEQRRPVAHEMGRAALVIAGAGSGKTRVLTRRAAYCILGLGMAPRRIACITFTNKAAKEMLDRVSSLMGVPATDPTAFPRISTIHSLSLSAIRKNPGGFGLSSKVTPLDSPDQRDLLKKLAEEMKLEKFNVYEFLDHVSYHRARGVGFAGDYTSEVHKQAQAAYAGAHALKHEDLSLWAAYEESKRKMSVVDFDDMLHLVVRRGREDDVWRAGLQRQFQTVLLDESQDSSPIQWQFIELLLPSDNQNLFAVGDPGQSIFGFNGASPEILTGMVDGWRGAVPALYKLEDNYRSLERVVTYANRIQSTMTDTVPLHMQFKRPSDPTPGKIILLQGVHGRDIAEAIAETIHHDNRLKTGPFKYKDNAILVRSSSQVRDIETSLVRLRIPYVVRGGQGLFQTQEARDLFAYLKLLVNPSDAMAFERAAGVPSRGIGPVAIKKLQATANKSFQGDLVRAAAESGHMKLQPFGQLVRELGAMASPVAVFQKIISATRYRDYIQERNRKNTDVVETKLANLDKLKEAIQGLMEVDPSATLADVVFRVTMDQKAESEEEGVVVISTIHAGKGLEWPRVYVTNLYEGSLPHQWSRTDREIEEERRLFYVAVTRARDVCALCIPATISYGPNTRNVSPSRFLVELRTV